MIQVDHNEIREWTAKSEHLLIKKLSRNDCSWADGAENGHQNGVYIPREIRESDFFPTLKNLNSLKPHIFEARFGTLWPQTGEVKESRLTHYSNKGTEMHFTRVPREVFSELTPASLLIGGVLREAIGEVCHWFLVIDSASDEAEMLETVFDLESNFHFGLFDPMSVSQQPRDETDQLIDELTSHLKAGTLDRYISSVCKLPAPQDLARDAQLMYLKQYGLSRLDPYVIDNPGDAIMQISRDIEYRLYKRAELRHRAAEVIRIVTDGDNVVSTVVRRFPELDALFLSASQLRKSRAGRSFEQHISRILSDGEIPFEEQQVTGGRRPDFVLPDLKVLNDTKRPFTDAIVLSAKTTLRERWKQIVMEKFNCSLFLATVDDRISSEAIEDMNKQGICLVVPESLKKSKETCYKDKTNVITFRDFFDTEIAAKRSGLRKMVFGNADSRGLNSPILSLSRQSDDEVC